MQGTMMSMPLTISSLITHAAKYHGATEVVSVETDGAITRTDWAGIERGARKLAAALGGLGLKSGDRVATIAWNNARHLMTYFGVSGGGMVCHTINPRLAPEQIAFIINDAQDRALLIDRTFLPAAAKLVPACAHIEHVVLLGPRDEEAAAMLPGILFFDELLAGADPDYTWPALDENTPSSLCYTSGTTGHPKGVLYTHRSTVLHTLGSNQPDGLALSARDSVLPVVPMFHVNAWGVPYIAAAVGSKLVLPGPGLDGASLVRLIDGEAVTLALGVPTIWMGLLAALEKSGSKAETLIRTVVGGAALPPSMIPAFRDKYGVELIHAWGMTETSPLGTLNGLLQKHTGLNPDEQAAIRTGQGRPPYGVELRLVDDDGAPLPEDGKTQGNLQIRGHWIAERYYKADTASITDDGWFDTGDVATIDPDGYMVIRDRSKDIVKSGGEWISTVELENIAVAHPEVAMAAVIAARHDKWGERPLLLVVAAEGTSPDTADILASFEGMVPHWQVPDRVIVVDSLPLGGTGKVLKNRLREEYGDVLISA